LSTYVFEHGRLPRAGEKRQPWTYRGWLLPYLVGCHSAGLCENRWGYQFEALNAGKLPDSEIPQIHFGDSAHPGAMKEVLKWVDIVGRDEGGWSSYLRLIDWLCFGLGIGDEVKLQEKTQDALYRGVNLAPILEHPYDYFGTIMSEHKGSGRWNPSGFYPTPHSVCELMTRTTFGGDDARKLTVCDPCVGTGRMLLHASNRSVNLYGMDIDWTCVQICKMNGAFYAPWMTWPLSARILGVPVPAPPPTPLRIANDPVLVLPDPEPILQRRRRIDSKQGNLFEGL
jgi:hypothetical protein